MKKTLGVNIDHVATIREARGGIEPSVLDAALQVQSAGADGITIHLREDRRHIQDADVINIKRAIKIPLNLEMSTNPGIMKFALKVAPEKVCIVPEKRQELTTEGGLNVLSKEKLLKREIPKLAKKKVEVSLFIDPDEKQIRASHRVGAHAIELHTGTYANAKGKAKEQELQKIKKATALAHQLGLKVNAGHGLDYQNVKKIAKIDKVEELNIGHSIVSYSVFVGLKKAVRDMKKLIAGK